MDTFTIKSLADVLSFIGHTLGFWPRESLVCITLVDNHVGATLRVDLPKHGAENSYAQTIAGYLAHDAKAASIVFALYTSLPATPGRARPHAATIAALTGALAERGITIREGLLVGDDAVSQYDGDPEGGPSLPLTSTQSSQINAEFVCRGSTIAPTNRITLPASTKETQTADAVESCVESMQSLNSRDAIDRARTLWTEMLESISFPADEQIVSLIAGLQFPTIRDQLMADIPGIDEPMDRVLLAQTDSKPHWSRVEWAEQLLLHAYTYSNTQHAAPILTAMDFINWWEGRGSKAHQLLQLVFEAGRTCVNANRK
ncbi:hypothetical protein BJG92_03454 [Arthrobacter sp. SO5]|uniref:DUF4192 family protein n=1 Tax=Arthrobacter sp. SO5 TaxID=1897055 RepID=UPI001E5CF7E6|nr:DUF4192 family protein [Arthrobacter sp. SO5]MCB5275900.1 hypothetical protein [Arthrobacter sp. SO5]